MYGWLLRVKDVGSVLMNRSVAAMSTASEYAAASLRAAAARAIDQLWSVIADCLRAFKPDECRNYFEAAGYDPE